MDNREWYFAKGDKKFGPMALADLQHRIATGEVERSDLVWGQGDPDWRTAGDVPELFAASAGGTPPPPPPRRTAPWPAPEEPRRRAVSSQRIPNYLWQSIVVTLLCCNPIAIVAIVYAAKVDGLWQQGDTEAAWRASNTAKTWCIVAFVLSLASSAVWMAVGPATMPRFR